MPVVRGLDHVNIHTSRPDETIAFYVELLGLEDRPEARPALDAPGAWLWAGDRPVLHLIFLDADPGPHSGPLDHIAFEAHDFDEVRERFRRNGVDHQVKARPHLGLQQIFAVDPNGIRVEIGNRTNPSGHPAGEVAPSS